VQRTKASFLSRFVALLLLCGLVPSSQAATRALERIETKLGDKENTIIVHMNVPVRYVSHVMNDADNEVNLQLQLIPTPDVSIADLVSSDQLSWKPSAQIPLDKVVFRGQLVGNSSMQITFASPVQDFQVRQGKDFYVVEFVFKKPKQVVALPPEQPSAAPAISIKDVPDAIYVLNLSSQERPFDMSRVAPIPKTDGLTLYATQSDLEGQNKYHLRLGFFKTVAAAKAELKSIKNFYPKAWIDQADVVEQRRALKLPAGAPLPPPSGKAEKARLKPADERLAKQMELTRRTMTAGDYPKAIRMLEAILEEPANPYSQEARELLGLARQRNGQIAHAKAEYRTYLKLYPKGEGTERVRQRLLGLVTSTQKPREPLRQEQPEEQLATWETYGSFSQNYRRDSIDSPFVDDSESVTRSDIETFLDFNTHRQGPDYDLRMKLTTGYVHDLLDENLGDGDESYLSDAYVDLEHRDSRSNMRLGRQRLRSSGIFNRFDGLVLGYELTPDVRIRAVGGLPVESTRDTNLNEHKRFVGVNGDIANVFENWDMSLYFVEQHSDDLIDRRALGGELRYFDPNRSLFSLVDYDIHYNSLNIFMVQGNWTLADQTSFYMNLDYRNAPLLQTSNALLGQTDPATLFPILTLDHLQELYPDDTIYDLAADRTAKTRTVSVGASRPLNPTLQVSGDITMTKTDDIPASGGVEAIEGTGNEFYYSLQVIKNDLIKKGDIGVFGLRYADASTSNTVQLTASSRYPVTNFWRVNPKFAVSYRKNKDNDGKRLTVSPFLQMDYRLRKSFTLEMEAGLNWYKEDDGVESFDFTDYFFLAGYRWDF